MSVTDGLILSSKLGDINPTAFGANPDVPDKEGAIAARVDGNATAYIIYKMVDFEISNEGGTSKVVDSTSKVDAGWNIRSFQSRDKKGIILFSKRFYGGRIALLTQSSRKITDAFNLPAGQEAGLSSFIVYEGTWSIFTDENYHGTKLQMEVNGKVVTEFGPGIYMCEMIYEGTHLDDKAVSVQKIM